MSQFDNVIDELKINQTSSSSNSDDGDMFNYEFSIPQDDEENPNHLIKNYDSFLQWWNDCKSIDLQFMDNSFDKDKFFSSLKILIEDDTNKEDTYHQQLKDIKEYLDKNIDNFEDRQKVCMGMSLDGADTATILKIMNSHILQKFLEKFHNRIKEMLGFMLAFETANNKQQINPKNQVQLLSNCTVRVLDLAYKYMGFDLICIIRKHTNQELTAPLKYSEIRFITNAVSLAINDYCKHTIKVVISNSFDRLIHMERHQKDYDKNPFQFKLDKIYLENWI